MELGLKRNEVRLVPYTSDWYHEFEEVKQAISQQTGMPASRVEHMGSTAIDGMPAKPIIDLLIGVDDLEAVSEFLANLQKLGFYRLKVERPGEIVLAKFTDETFETKTHFIHLVKYEDELWQNLLFFRDYLIAHKEARDAYAELKLAFTKRSSSGINEYTDHKEAFVKHIVSKRGDRK